jgi:hypothetical protein
MVKYCKCGCGDTVKNEWVRGHVARVHNNWGHNLKAIENSANTRREQYKNGERKVWNDGLTIEDERVANNGKQVSKAFTQDRKDRYSKIMKKNRLDGTVPTLYGRDSSRWQGGTSPLSARVYASNRLYSDWKFPILKKAEFKCEECGDNKNLHVHHDKERMADILKSFVKDENPVEKVVDYHIYSKVSGVVLCKIHHIEQHPSLNF